MQQCEDLAIRRAVQQTGDPLATSRHPDGGFEIGERCAPNTPECASELQTGSVLALAGRSPATCASTVTTVGPSTASP